MHQHIKKYAEELFSGTAATPEAEMLHDEVLANMISRYDECVAGGMDRYAAYDRALEIGNSFRNRISFLPGAELSDAGLFGKIEAKLPDELKNMEINQLKTIFRSITAVVWLAAFAFFIATVRYFNSLSMIGFGAAAILTCLLSTVKKIIILRNNGGSDAPKSIMRIVRNCIIMLMWMFAVMIFFFFAMSDLGELSFLVLLIAAGVNVGICAVFKIIQLQKEFPVNRPKILKTAHGALSALLWIGASVLFFFVCIFLNGEEGTLIIFIAAVIVQIIMNMLFKLNR